MVKALFSWGASANSSPGMQEEGVNRRNLFIGLLTLLYALPLILLAFGAKAEESQQWRPIVLYVTLAMTGTLLLILYTRRYAIFADTVFSSDGKLIASGQRTVLQLQEEIERIKQELEEREGEIHSLTMSLQSEQEGHTRAIEEKKHVQADLVEANQARENLRGELEAKLRAKEKLIEEYSQTISDQREIIQKRQGQIDTFSNKINDLQYELRMLLDLNQNGYASKGSDEEVALAESKFSFVDPAQGSPSPHLLLLQQIVEMAQKYTGARHLSDPSPKFQKLNEQGYGLELCRLCDQLSRSEGMLLFYSRREDQLLFCHEEVHKRFGWSTEKFIQRFSEFVLDGYDSWRQSLRRLVPGKPIEVALKIRTKNGDAVETRCHMGLVPTGVFKLHVVMVLEWVG
ncbi:MAG: hypothetical protein KDK40_04010 [Chlamydiia bacterium]|nr:hypothetical protein [Chlamydiia bacterium]